MAEYMPINFERAFGIHEQALILRTARASVLASNLANADTPNYKARDIDFKTALAEAAKASSGSALKTTHHRHMSAHSRVSDLRLSYRWPLQPSLDGNTVDAQVERSAFMENALHHQASLSFLQGKIEGLRTAIRGE